MRRAPLRCPRGAARTAEPCRLGCPSTCYMTPCRFVFVSFHSVVIYCPSPLQHHEVLRRFQCGTTLAPAERITFLSLSLFLFAVLDVVHVLRAPIARAVYMTRSVLFMCLMLSSSALCFVFLFGLLSFVIIVVNGHRPRRRVCPSATGWLLVPSGRFTVCRLYILCIRRL